MKRSIFGGVGLVVIAVIAVALYLSVFIVEQTQQALVLRFGQVVRAVQSPGLYYKLPLVDNVVYLDKRILDLDSPTPLEVIASDQKRLVVDAFGRYKIVDPLLFFQSLGTPEIANSRLLDLLNSAVRRVLGDASFMQLVRDDRADLMTKITTALGRETVSLGVEIVDVKIRSADLPAANSQAIYQRMQTERQRQATELRAQGEQEARRIRAEADRTATVIVAEATGESERLRGDGEAEQNRILSGAFGADANFFAFYRSMQAYQKGLAGSDTRMILAPDSEFFRYFNSAEGNSTPTFGTAGGAPVAAPSPAPAPPPAPAPAPSAAPAAPAPAAQ